MKKPTFSDRLIEAMKLRSLKAADLSRETGITAGLISDYINGIRKQPRHEKVHKLANALNVNTDWLMGYDVPLLFRYHHLTQGDEFILTPAGENEMPKRGVRLALETEQDTDNFLKLALFGSTKVDDEVLRDVKEMAKMQLEQHNRRKLSKDGL